MHKPLYYIFLSITLLLATRSGYADEPVREIAITMDDLPFVGEQKNRHLSMIIDAAKNSAIPLTGFIIAREVEENNWETLRKFKEAGFSLGNHTFSHANLKRSGTEKYIQEIAVADKMLSSVLSEPKYFRYPYLEMGKGEKKEAVLDFLAESHYKVAPITIDSRDFTFNQLLLSVPEANRRSFMEFLKPCYLDYIWKQTLQAEEHNKVIHRKDQAQILLIHANLLNAYALEDIINLYRQKGYTIVSLDKALKSFAKKEPTLKVAEEGGPDTFVQWD